MTTAPNTLALDGGDPRAPAGAIITDMPVELAMVHGMHDRSVTFEEYVHYARITREEEKIAHQHYVAAQGPKTLKSILKNRFSRGNTGEITAVEIATGTDAAVVEKENGVGEKTKSPADSNSTGGVLQPTSRYITKEEWKRASRAIRTAGWSSVFYLITTDILGPFSVPWAFAQMGYGPGIALYTVFGVLACYSGYQIWNAFMELDSDRYPLKSYGDLFFRVYGRWARHCINVLQSIQLLFTVAILILSNGQSISQISKSKVCFVACLVIFMAAGMIVGQIRTLQRFSWLANFAVWINVLILFICMGVVANSPPNYATIESSFGPAFGPGPVHTYAGTPPAGKATGGSGFVGSINGLNQAVYSYGGAMLFVAFLAEMRHPWDFWKGLLCADIFIYVCYMFFGIFVYSYQGQYAFNPVMQGLSPYNWQTAANIMNLITGLIAAVLYGNIGIKVAYVDVFQELLNAPPLTSRSGKALWIALVPLYWAIAFVVCAAIPQFSYISGLVGAVCILQFTYTFPALLAFGFQIQRDGMTPDEHFDPNTRIYHKIDTGLRRLWRGFKVKWWLNSFNLIYFLGALCTSALGIYSSVLGLISAFDGQSSATSFGCTPPV